MNSRTKMSSPRARAHPLKQSTSPRTKKSKKKSRTNHQSSSISSMIESDYEDMDSLNQGSYASMTYPHPSNNNQSPYAHTMNVSLYKTDLNG